MHYKLTDSNDNVIDLYYSLYIIDIYFSKNRITIKDKKIIDNVMVYFCKDGAIYKAVCID